MATTKPRVMVTVDEETYEEILAFKKEHRLLTTSQAARQIMIMGIKELEKELDEEERKKRNDEEDGGVLPQP